MTAERRRLVLLGVGYVARAVAALAGPGREVVGTTRSAARAGELRAAGIEPVVSPGLDDKIVRELVSGADVLVSFPPDGATDRRVAPACGAARAIVYVSSTAVYGDRRGRIDDETPVARHDRRARPRLEAEEAWRGAAAVVIRAPGIYGRERGLHVRLRTGGYRIPGDGTGVVSRIHVEDLARFVLAAFERRQGPETFVVSDVRAVPQIEVVRWLCERMGLPLPDSIPIDQAHETLRGSRAIDPHRALAELGVTLRFPTYREGFANALDADAVD